MIYILSAPIQSGKTTSLINWSAARKDVHGILTPVIHGMREFMNAETKELFPMEAKGDEETLIVGKFIFSKAGFDKAIQIISDAITKEGWLVIDEIGPMELRGEGFCNVLKQLLKIRTGKTILVVREGMTEKVKICFMINATEVNSIDDI
jgi:nucleoside-triphosphatase THEP1